MTTASSLLALPLFRTARTTPPAPTRARRCRHRRDQPGPRLRDAVAAAARVHHLCTHPLQPCAPTAAVHVHHRCVRSPPPPRRRPRRENDLTAPPDLLPSPPLSTSSTSGRRLFHRPRPALPAVASSSTPSSPTRGTDATPQRRSMSCHSSASLGVCRRCQAAAPTTNSVAPARGAYSRRPGPIAALLPAWTSATGTVLSLPSRPRTKLPRDSAKPTTVDLSSSSHDRHRRLLSSLS